MDFVLPLGLQFDHCALEWTRRPTGCLAAVATVVLRQEGTLRSGASGGAFHASREWTSLEWNGFPGWLPSPEAEIKDSGDPESVRICWLLCILFSMIQQFKRKERGKEHLAPWLNRCGWHRWTYAFTTSLDAASGGTSGRNATHATSG